MFWQLWVVAGELPFCARFENITNRHRQVSFWASAPTLLSKTPVESLGVSNLVQRLSHLLSSESVSSSVLSPLVGS